MQPTVSTSFFASAPCEPIRLPIATFQHKSGYSWGGTLSEHREYLEGIGQIRSAGERRSRRYGEVHTVMYPCCAFDTSAVSLFPAADTFIGIDIHPFVAPHGEVRERSIITTYHQPFYYANDIDQFVRRSSICELILGTLVAMCSEIDILDIHEFRDTCQIVGGCRAVHGELLFRIRGDESVKRYIHINADISDLGEASMPWWLARLNENPPDAVLVKGAMSALSHDGARGKIVDWIVKSEGILIEGDSSPPRKDHCWEFAGDHDFGVHADSILVGGVRFGYGKSARITSFTPQPQQS